MLVELPIFSEPAQNDVFVLVIFGDDNWSFCRMKKCVAVARVADAGLVASLNACDPESDNMITTQFNNY